FSLMKKTTRSIRSESKASARSESSEPRQRSPMRSITPLESGSAICQSPSISCCAPESNSRQTANEPSEGVELIGIGGGEDRADALANHPSSVLISGLSSVASGSGSRVHPLRVTDALPLAAAFPAAERRPPSLEMVTLDDRLANAARGRDLQ